MKSPPEPAFTDALQPWVSAVRDGTAHADPWMERMRLGDFAGAWEISDAVMRARAGVPCSTWPRHLQYVWDGSPVDGKRVLVRCYHGLGDTVQFVRFLEPLRRRARHVTLWAQRQLIPLLRSVRGVDALLPLHDGSPDVDYDVDVEVMELAHVFRVTPETIPAQVPYLSAPVSREHRCERRLRVGLIWSAGEWDSRRSVPVSELEPLGRICGVSLQVLQQGPARREWPIGWGEFAGSTRVAELAAAMQQMDLIISVDSFTAHLAGALGRPTWTLLHADPDWRWMRERSDSPWYPTMRLWRQSAPGEWGDVVARVASELERTARASG